MGNEENIQTKLSFEPFLGGQVTKRQTSGTPLKVPRDKLHQKYRIFPWPLSMYQIKGQTTWGHSSSPFQRNSWGTAGAMSSDEGPWPFS